MNLVPLMAAIRRAVYGAHSARFSAGRGRWRAGLCLAAVCAGGAPGAFAQTGLLLRAVSVPDPGLSPSLTHEAQAAVSRGARWLLAQQQADGHWSNPDTPALTALPLWALLRAGVSNAATDRAIRHLVSHAQSDGSIQSRPGAASAGLSSYNTAVCLAALHAAGRPELMHVILNARRFLSGRQPTGADWYEGDWAFDPRTKTPYAQIGNSDTADDSKRLTRNLESLRDNSDPRAQLDWPAAARFIARLQNRASTNGLLPGLTDPPIPEPTDDAARIAGGARPFRTDDRMTYAGWLSFIHSDGKRDDPRVRLVYEWAVQHWTLEENPGMGPQGLYYFYHALAKSLAAYGVNPLTLADGTALNWRDELVRKLVNLQQIDARTGGGYWVNREDRWWEDDPVLVTAYALLTLELALNE